MKALKTDKKNHIVELPYPKTPLDYFRKIQHLKRVVWLDSGYPSLDHSRFDILSAEPLKELTCDQNDDARLSQFFTQAAQAVDALGRLNTHLDIPFQGGLLGYFSYEFNHARLNITSHRATQSNPLEPFAAFGLYDWALIIDHEKKCSFLFFHPKHQLTLRKKIESLFSLNQSSTLEKFASKPLDFKLTSPFVASESKQQYLDNIQRIQHYLKQGDAYQVNYTQHFACEFLGDIKTAYASQRSAHPAPFSAFIEFGNDFSILSHSPEEFLHLWDKAVRTQPIKGTAPRTKNALQDQVLAQGLLASEKDKAENLMIVDLMRHELGKCCRVGSIKTKALFNIKSFCNVHHLTSTIEGELTDESNALSLHESCLPGGSITGAPKRRAMQIIDELEATPRSVYCGSIGYFSSCGNSHSNIAIRTMIASQSRLHCWGGGGITFDSVPTAEYQETLDKVGPMMRSLEQTYG